MLQSSPKAEALHRLRLPMRLERLLIYPLLLFLMQYSGLAVKLRAWLTERWLPPLQRLPGFILELESGKPSEGHRGM